MPPADRTPESDPPADPPKRTVPTPPEANRASRRRAARGKGKRADAPAPGQPGKLGDLPRGKLAALRAAVDADERQWTAPTRSPS